MADLFKIVFLLFASVYLVQAKNEEYDGSSVYEIAVTDYEQTEKLNKIIDDMDLDRWSYAFPGQQGHVLVPKGMKPLFEQALNEIAVEYRIETENIKEKLELEEKLMAEAALNSSFSRSGINLDVIHRYADVDQYLTDLARRFPNRVRVVSAGRTYEGRDIKYLRISSNDFANNSKPIVVIQSLLHAREWVTLPVTLHAIDKLVIDVTDQDLVNDVDWIIIPIANPDGYEFSHTNSRFWRKNRRPGFGIRTCTGVDLNRNNAFNFGTASGTSACSDTYHGSRAFSEPETQMMRDIVEQFRNRIALYIDAHSFGSMVLFAYGNRQLPSNALVLNQVGVQIVQAIDRVKWPAHRNYRLGNIAAILAYTSSGRSSDYVQSMIGNRLSYTFELPGYKGHFGLNGFLVDPAFIRQAGFETWEGIKVAARYVVRNRDTLMDEVSDE